MYLIKKIIKSSLKRVGYNISRVEQAKPIFTAASRLLEKEFGHYNSKQQQQSIDGHNDAIPWFTYPAIDYLRQLDLSDKTMLEWGSGNSSLFFSKRVKQLYSIEHNAVWYKQVHNWHIYNQVLKLEDENYADAPLRFNEDFDIILIDGIDRAACAEQSLELIKSGGVIILDNSDRYPSIAERFRNLNFIEVDFHGFGPINDYTWTTSIFFQRDFNFMPLSFQPTIPIGGGF